MKSLFILAMLIGASSGNVIAEGAALPGQEVGRVTTKDLKLNNEFVVVKIYDKAAEHLYLFLAEKLGTTSKAIVTENISCFKSNSVRQGQYSLPVLSFECSMILDEQGNLLNNGGNTVPVIRD